MMLLFEWTLVLLLAAVLLAGLARRVGVPYPALLALAGTGLAFSPFTPRIEIDPELSLALFVAPVLLDAAYDTSPRELRRHLNPLIALALFAVLFTTIAVAIVGYTLAGLPIAAAIALGAIVAPPDAAAAAAVLSQLKVPQRVLLLLQGESLWNDATALLIYRIAIAATLASFSLVHALPMLVLSALLSPVAGYLLARLYKRATAGVRDPASATILQFVGTFGVWLLADRLGLSAIITMVVYAMVLAQSHGPRMDARMRVSSYAVWETVVRVLNVLAFVLMGLQARTLLLRLADQQGLKALIIPAIVLLTVILTRIVWVMGYYASLSLTHRWQRRGAHSESERRDSNPIDGNEYRNGVVVAWCGMRGVVTLAAAFALPPGFPGRDVIELCAFCVVLGTLVIQGLTLRPLLRCLQLQFDGAPEREVSHARRAMMQAALDALSGDPSPAASAVREQYEAARSVAESAETPQAATDHDRLRLRAIHAQRKALDDLRSSGQITDEVFHRLQEEIDWSELDAAPAGSFQPLATDAVPPIATRSIERP